MLSPTSNLPDATVLVQAARNIVFDAREKNKLDSLTVKSVRKQVERDFSLDEGALEVGDIKITLRNAVNAAVAEEIVVASATKRKRSAEPKGAKPKSREKKSKGKTGSDGGEESGTGQKKKKKSRVTKSKKSIESDVEVVEDAPPSKTASTSKSKQNTKEASVPAESKQTNHISVEQDVQMVEAEKSESELSALIDEPRKKKRTKGKAKDAPKATKGKKAKEPATVLDKDEETVKRLKSYVTACGVRKTWSKEFADLPNHKQQIARLKEILADLGMTGKYTMEKAKGIKEKRALARELNDVLEYERKAGASRASRNHSQTSKVKRPVGELDTDSDVQESSEHEEDEQDSPAVKRNKNTASRSIMAYMANQSSDEDD